MKLSNKALAVLELLRDGGELSAHDVAETIRERTPCGECNGTGEGDNSHFGCRRCYGRGRVMFGYSDAYRMLELLRRRNLVRRRHRRDEFGDELRGFFYSAIDAETDDELEALYRAPAARRDA